MCWQLLIGKRFEVGYENDLAKASRTLRIGSRTFLLWFELFILSVRVHGVPWDVFRNILFDD
jgi:hypothetical protein